MRIGTNPVKHDYHVGVENYHRVVIPVYIPNFEGYFTEAFEIFKMCLESLLLTVHEKTRITVYNNDSHPKVKEYIDEQYRKNNLIDQVFHSKVNLGKVNAILSAVKGNLEPLITITDADVLFKKNWQQEVEKLFISFPEAGMISPVPASKAYNQFTANNWGRFFLSGKMSFEDVLDPQGLELFDKSLGDERSLYDPIHLKKYLTVEAKDGTKACVGCGHFVATLRREVFDNGTECPAFIKIGGGVEKVFIDQPNETLGFLRLATLGNHAFHMGNVRETWMDEEFGRLSAQAEKIPYFEARFPDSKVVSTLEHYIGKLICRLSSRNLGKRLIFAFLGMKEKY